MVHRRAGRRVVQFPPFSYFYSGFFFVSHFVFLPKTRLKERKARLSCFLAEFNNGGQKEAEKEAGRSLHGYSNLDNHYGASQKLTFPSSFLRPTEQLHPASAEEEACLLSLQKRQQLAMHAHI